MRVAIFDKYAIVLFCAGSQRRAVKLRCHQALYTLKIFKLVQGFVACRFDLLSSRTGTKVLLRRCRTLRDRGASSSSHNILCLSKYFNRALAKMSHSHIFFGHLHIDRPMCGTLSVLLLLSKVVVVAYVSTKKELHSWWL